MNPGYRLGISSISQSRVVTSKYTFPALEASPFILGAIAITLWEAILPGPDRIEHLVDYTWCIPVAVIVQLATGYLIYHGLHKLRYQWYPILPMTRAYLDLIRTYSSCYIIGIVGVSVGVRMVFVMVSYMDPYDAKSNAPTANSIFRIVCIFLVLAYTILGLGIGILVSRPLIDDRKRLRTLEEGLDR